MEKKDVKLIVGSLVFSLGASTIIGAASTNFKLSKVNENKEIVSSVEEEIFEDVMPEVEEIEAIETEEYDLESEKEVLKKYCANIEVFENEEYRSIEKISIEWVKGRYKIIGTHQDGSVTIYLDAITISGEIFNYMLHRSKCSELEYRGDQGVNLLFSLTEFENLKKLAISDCDMTTLDGIEKFPNLEELVVTNCKNLTSIEAIGELSNLEKLLINGTMVEDVSSLQNLDKLYYVNLRCNEIKNPETLANLKSLETAKLEYNAIEDVEKLKPLIDNGMLDELSATSICDVNENSSRVFYSTDFVAEDIFAVMVQYYDSKDAYFFVMYNENYEVNGLCLTANPVDFDGLTNNLPNCKGIYFDNLPENNVNLIWIDKSFRKNIEFIVIARSSVNDISFVSDYPNIKVLQIKNCPNLTHIFSDSIDAYGINQLESVYITETNIESIGQLQYLDSIKEMELEDNAFKSFDFLTNLSNLERIQLESDVYPIDLSPLEELLENGVEVYGLFWYPDKVETKKYRIKRQ